ncbi:GD12051 [Drosophila simulans]|uniref:GD12051 n=1 Tax=Drosophila simulans TaxID=7240 RepID=B4QLB0_DROSI|nr:GD12051 [Drosophila simulans]
MELERELPTDDASVELDVPDPWGDVRSSDSQLTLKQSESQETIRPSGYELADPSELSSYDIHLGLLVEKGLIDINSLDKSSNEDPTDYADYRGLLSMSADRGGIAEIVKEMRNEFMDKLTSKAKSFKEILIKKGLMEPKDENPVMQNDDSKKKSKPEDESQIPDRKNSAGKPKNTSLGEGDVRRNGEIALLINEINQFTSGMEKDPDTADWAHFRANLLKIHNYYVSNANANEPEERGQEQPNSQIGAVGVSEPSEDISEPMEDLSSRAQNLRKNIRGLECKMLTLDHSVDIFSDKFNRSLVTKEHVEREMVAIALVRDKIGRRLNQMEEEFRRAREDLFDRGRNAKNQSYIASPLNNPDCGA